MENARVISGGVSIARTGLLVLVVMACGATEPAPASSKVAADIRCELPESTVLRRDGNAIVEAWELPAAPVWFGETLPDAPGYLAYRAAIRAAGGDTARPVADHPSRRTMPSGRCGVERISMPR